MMMKRSSGSTVVGDTKVYGVVAGWIGALGLDKELWSGERVEGRVVPGLGPAASNPFAGESEMVEFTTGTRELSLFCSILFSCSTLLNPRQRGRGVLRSQESRVKYEVAAGAWSDWPVTRQRCGQASPRQLRLSSDSVQESRTPSRICHAPYFERYCPYPPSCLCKRRDYPYTGYFGHGMIRSDLAESVPDMPASSLLDNGPTSANPSAKHWLTE